MTRAPETATDLGGLLAELEWRGILQETTPGLPARLATGRPISGYIGFDPTADSLHVGHLVPDLRAASGSSGSAASRWPWWAAARG